MPVGLQESPFTRLRCAAMIALCTGFAILVGCDKLQMPQMAQPAANPVVPANTGVPAAMPTQPVKSIDPPAPPAKASAQEIVAAFLEKASKPGGVNDKDLIDVTELTEGLDSVTELRLSGAGITDAGIIRLNRFPKLVNLDLSASGVTEVGIAVLKDLPDLRTLGLGYSMIGDTAMKQVGALNELTELNLAKTAVSDLGVAELGKLNKLEVLDISEAAGITGTFFQNLKTNKKLRVLRAHHTVIRPEAIQFLVNCPIEELNLEATPMNDLAMVSINKLDTLKILNLGHCGITDDGIRKMVVMKDLETVSFRNNAGISSFLFNKLMRSKKLKSIDVSGTRIKEADVAKLNKILPECQIRF